MKKYILDSILVLSVIVLFMTTGFGSFYEFENKDRITEEAIPIREEEIITGLNYHITIGKNVQDSSLVISSKILDSIVHYKDTHMIEDFTIHLIIHNQTENSYLLKKIYIIDSSTNIVKKDISYVMKNNEFLFHLDSFYFKEYKKEDQVFIELEK